MKIPFLDEVENRGIEKGIEQGRAEGRNETILANLRYVMDSFNVPVEKAMEVLKVPEHKYQYFLEQLQASK